MALSDTQIEHLTRRFLGWKLPADFAPDAGIVFTPLFTEPMRSAHWPVGTNLLNYDQAKAMITELAKDMPDA